MHWQLVNNLSAKKFSYYPVQLPIINNKGNQATEASRIVQSLSIKVVVVCAQIVVECTQSLQDFFKKDRPKSIGYQ